MDRAGRLLDNLKKFQLYLSSGLRNNRGFKEKNLGLIFRIKMLNVY